MGAEDEGKRPHHRTPVYVHQREGLCQTGHRPGQGQENPRQTREHQKARYRQGNETVSEVDLATRLSAPFLNNPHTYCFFTYF